MAAPSSSALSIACRAIAEFVRSELTDNGSGVQVTIGTPAKAAPQTGETKQLLNLFFYRIEPAGFFTQQGPADPWLIRLYCLITAFGVDEAEDETPTPEDSPPQIVSAGEIDLRILGEVVRIFHETPVLFRTSDGAPITVGGEQVTLQVVFRPLGLEEINHIWSTQGDVAYRPSVAYEFALWPIVPRAEKPLERRVGALGLEVHATMDARSAPFSGQASAPPVTAGTVNTDAEDWAPLICFVVNDTCEQSLALETGSSDLGDLEVWVAGDVEALVTLQWEVWGQRGWEAAGDTVDATPSSPSIDPEQAETAQTVTVGFPPGDVPAQWTLYAERRFARGADGAEIGVRSNPLLATVFTAPTPGDGT